ncbi:SpoIIE family protein phosphatase, partial [Aeromicrobium sp.]|uniref:PP2C family protein-serine/threonine phosphatase n=1 Tax=Aeromicrobium sp. TaxID=1871063 RepID=UPI0019A9E3AB
MIDLVEQARRRGLDVLQVLDTPPEERFDRFTRLAQTAFDVPISTVTLIDRDRAYFKSCVGFDIVEVPRESTFCARTVLIDEPMIVNDARLDPRFQHLPVVTGEPSIRFYAGFPLHDSQGTAIGTFCLFDTRTRTLSKHELDLMAELSGWVEAELQSSGDMERARKVQQSLLPRTPPSIDGYETAAMCLAAGVVAGDFFDYQNIGSQHSFLVADVMGKGTGAAILMATTRAVVRSANSAFADGRFGATAATGEVLTEVNTILFDDLEASAAFVTGFFGWADPATGQIRYVDAGHGLTLAVRAVGSHQILPTTDLPLGVTADWTWTEHHLNLDPGDLLLC